MNIDFSAILVVALFVSGSLVIFDALVDRAKRGRNLGSERREPNWLIRQARSLLPIIIVVLAVRSFVFEPFRIPSASMMPGLVDGDFIVVNKFSYGLRLPVLNTKILSIGEPERGDVIVFRLPTNPSVNYIKRLIGKPGDHVTVRNNQVTINGVAVSLRPAGRYSGGYGFDGAQLVSERLDAGDHLLMLAQNRVPTDFDGLVPAGQYFLMGDNRNDSEDGRFPVVGFVPEKNLVGHAVRIWLNLQLPHWPKWNRIGTKII